MSKLKIIIFCSLLVILVTMPELILELFHLVFEYILEFGHILFELVEMLLDTVIEHTFETGLHQTQIVVFYIIMAPIFYGLYRLGKIGFAYCIRCKQRWVTAKSMYTTQVTEHWSALGLFKKIQYWSALITFLSLLVLFLFM